jgi:NAD(P)-dependent dehydrogenase (short-subunit alcohol dehydrogenase family)
MLTEFLQDWYTHKMHRIGTLKGSIVVAGASNGLGIGFVHELLSQPDAAREYYGLYFAETAHGSTIGKVLMRARKVEHEYELMDLHLSDLTSTRKLAETINRRVALGLMPQIAALVLSADVESQVIERKDLRINETASGERENKRFLSQFLLMLLLLQSMDKESGRIVFLPAGNKTKGEHTGHRHASIEHGDSTTKRLLHSHQSTPDPCQSCIG